MALHNAITGAGRSSVEAHDVQLYRVRVVRGIDRTRGDRRAVWSGWSLVTGHVLMTHVARPGSGYRVSHVERCAHDVPRVMVTWLAVP